jgi:hypothetical protein
LGENPAPMRSFESGGSLVSWPVIEKENRRRSAKGKSFLISIIFEIQ